MIRRDYLLRMIEQCIQALTRSLRLSREQQFEAARTEVDRLEQQVTSAFPERAAQGAA